MRIKQKLFQIFLLIFTILPVLFIVESKTYPVLIQWTNTRVGQYIPLFILLVSAFLSVKIQKTQIFFLVLFYSFLYLLFLYKAPFNYSLLTFVLPLTITWITMLKTVNVTSRHMLFQTIGIGIIIAIGYYIAIYIANPQAKFLILFVKNMQAAQWLKFWKLPSLMFFLIPFLFLISMNFSHKALDLFFPSSWLSIIPILYVLNTEIVISQSSVLVTFAGISVLILYSIYQYFLSTVYKDELTGVLNRRALDEKMETLQENYSIAMMDVDHFKKFNDTFGHKEGDNVLRFVAQFLAEGLAVPIYRYGGEEFCAIFENEDPQKTLKNLKELCHKLSQKKFYVRRADRDEPNAAKKAKLKSKVSVFLTISIGMSTKVEGDAVADDIRKNADIALYKAKDRGRNQVVNIAGGDV